jgi:hypothetical protein
VVQSYNGNIQCWRRWAASINIAATVQEFNTLSSGKWQLRQPQLLLQAATLNGAISVMGCGTITSYGFEYSTTSGFANGTGTQVTASNFNSRKFFGYSGNSGS